MSKLSGFFSALLSLAVITGTAWGQVTIHYWNFNVGTPPTGTQWTTPIAATTGSGSLTHVFSNVQSQTGSALNSEGGDLGGGSLTPIGMENNGLSFTLALPTTGYWDPVLSYATRGSTTGSFTSHALYYSLNGTDFILDTTITGRGSTTFGILTVDFSDLDAADDNAEFKVKIVIDGATTSTGSNRFDNIKLAGTPPLSDGDGSASIVNLAPGILQGKDIFEQGAAGQSVRISVAGTSTGTLAAFSVTIPARWGWTGNAADVAPAANDLASLTNERIGGDGTSGWTITYDCAITHTAAGSIDIGNLSTPVPAAVTDIGNDTFRVYTAISGGTLAGIASPPVAYVVIPVTSIRDVDADGVPNDLGATVAVKGIATVAESVFVLAQLQVFLQDTGGGMCIFMNGTPPDFIPGNEYIVKGKVIQYGGLTELNPASFSDILDNGTSALPAPRVVSIAQLMADPEAYEGTFIGIQHLTRSFGTWPDSPAGIDVTLTMTDGSDTITMFIEMESTIDGNAEPAWPMDIQGIFSQYDNVSPYTGDFTTYRIVPRAFGDIQPDGSLPIQLASFSGIAEDGAVALRWSTMSERNNYGFYVERRSETGTYAAISILIPGAGTTLEEQTYNYRDESIPAIGIYYYRIRQVDLNGDATYVPEIRVEVSSLLAMEESDETPVKFGLEQNYPNPFNPLTHLQFTIVPPSRSGDFASLNNLSRSSQGAERNFASLSNLRYVTLKIYNILGEEVATLVNEVKEPGSYKVAWDATGMPSGVYVARLASGSQSAMRRLLLVR